MSRFTGTRDATSPAVHEAKIIVHRAGFDVTRDSFKHRFVHQLRQHGVETVLDVGANAGQFGKLLRQSRFRGRIHSVEPLRAAYQVLEATAAGDPLWTVQRAAVSARVQRRPRSSGPMARSVRDIALAYSLMAGSDGFDGRIEWTTLHEALEYARAGLIVAKPGTQTVTDRMH